VSEHAGWLFVPLLDQSGLVRLFADAAGETRLSKQVLPSSHVPGYVIYPLNHFVIAARFQLRRGSLPEKWLAADFCYRYVARICLPPFVAEECILHAGSHGLYSSVRLVLAWRPHHKLRKRLVNHVQLAPGREHLNACRGSPNMLHRFLQDNIVDA
jgi:hypothetical protein